MKIFFSNINFLPSGSFAKSPQKVFIPENGQDKQNLIFFCAEEEKNWDSTSCHHKPLY